MQQVFAFLLAAAATYLLGSVCFAIVVTRCFTGKDIRSFGSGNAGMTNVLRSIGKLPAFLTLLGDFGKSIFSVWFGWWIFKTLGHMDPMLGQYVGGFFVLLGHLFPVYYKFKGGKGVMTSAGTVLMLDWRIFLICIAIFAVVVLLTRMVSLGSILGVSAFPICKLIFSLVFIGTVRVDTLFALLIAAIIVYMHRGNIKRLLNGTEYKFGQKKA